MTNDTLTRDWLTYLEGLGRAPKTLKARACHLRQFSSRLDLATATEDELLAVFRERSDYSAETLHGMQATLRSFYGWAVRRGHVTTNPVLDIPTFRVPAGVPKPIDEVALRRALSLADPDTRRMLMLGAYAGLRISEIANLHESNISPNGIILKGKGGRTRRIPIHPLLAAELVDVNGWVFPSPTRPGKPVCTEYIAQRLKRVLPKPYTAHSLRHRFATQAYSTTHNIRAVQSMLGHTSPDTTARYVAIFDDDLAAAVNAIAA